MTEEGGERAGGRENVAESIVVVGSGDGTGFVRVAEDVADLVVEGEGRRFACHCRKKLAHLPLSSKTTSPPQKIRKGGQCESEC